MDHFSDSNRDVGTGNGIRLHPGWVYSPLARTGGHHRVDTVDHRTSSRLKLVISGPRARRSAERPKTKKRGRLGLSSRGLSGQNCLCSRFQQRTDAAR